MSEKRKILLDGKELMLSNLEKTFWDKEGYTKGNLLEYYAKISEWILPYLKNRPIVMKRYPNGVEGKAFYQKRWPDYAPEWLETRIVVSKRDKINYCLCNDAVSLLWLVNQGCIEIHSWLSQVEALDYPDFMVIDLDPSDGVAFSQVLEVATAVKECLELLGLDGIPKTSGATGVHIYVPVKNVYPYKEVRKAANLIANLVVQKLPDLATTERKVDLRAEKVYVDYMQNVKGKTMASVYSVRPFPMATVSTPLLWQEVIAGNITPQDFTIETVFDRLDKVGDLFEPLLKNSFLLEDILDSIKLGKSSNMEGKSFY